jgi:polyisoprenoid-binding protein YceI
MTAIATPTITSVSGYRAGRWVIDTVHSEVAFSVRHLMVSKVRGRFSRFAGELVTAEDPLASSVEATIDLASVDTDSEDRDAHLRSPDFLDVDRFPTLTYRSTGIRGNGSRFVVDGDLSLHGVTRSVPLALEVNGFLPQSPFGDSRVGFSAVAELSRKDFGIEFDAPLEGGGVVVGDKIQIALEVEAVLEAEDE